MPDPKVVTEENAEQIAKEEFLAEKKQKSEEGFLAEPPKEDSEKKEPPEEPDEEHKEPPKDGEPQEKFDEDLLSANPDELSEGEKTRRDELIEAEKTERERLLNAPEDDLSDEDKEKKKTVQLQIEQEEKDQFEQRIKDYAKEKNISEDDSRKTLESIKKVSSKYGNDRDKIAEGYLGLQRLVSEKDVEINKLKQESSKPRRPETAGEWYHVISTKGLVVGNEHCTPAKVAELYRKDNADLPEEITDEAVLKLVAKDISVRAKAHYDKLENDLQSKANEKRIELIEQIPEEDKPFADDVKKFINSVPAETVMNEKYTIEYALRWARGGRYHEDMEKIRREAEQKGYERGVASKKIVSGLVGAGKSIAKGKTTPSLNEKQKNEALEMFPNSTPEEAYDLYIDVQKNRPKNKKKKE